MRAAKRTKINNKKEKKKRKKEDEREREREREEEREKERKRERLKNVISCLFLSAIILRCVSHPCIIRE